MEQSPRVWRWDLLTGIVVYLVSAIPVAIGVVRDARPNLLESFFHFDGGHYIHLVELGYWYDPDRASGVAFFSGYPLAADAIIALTGVSSRYGLLIASNLFLIAAFAFFSAYLRKESPLTRWCSLAVLALWPVGISFRVAYSESMLLAVLALFMLGLARRCPIVVLAVIAGAATGVRAVGVAASAAVLLHLLMDASRGTLKKRFLSAAALAPITVWGLLAYMLFQFVQFDTPLAFVQTQKHWSVYVPEHREPIDKAMRLAIAEPIWGSYIPGSKRHWTIANEDENPFLGSSFWNPILFVLAGGLVVFGWYRRWLTREEFLLGFGLVAIPYLSRADEQSMISHARFAAVVLPAYLVMGRLLSQSSFALRAFVFALLAIGLTLWSGFFASGRPLL